MSVTSAEIITYASANMPEDNVSTSGGAIDTTTKVTFTDIAATDQVTIISDDAGDTTQTVTIYGRDGTGAIVSEPLSLNGTTRVTGAQAFERILKIVVNAAHDGTITVTRDNTPTFTEIATLESGILAVRRLFYKATADVSGGSERSYYEKIFIKNTNGSTALTDVSVIENADPGANITFDLEDAVDDNNSVSDRLDTAPTGMLGTFTSADKTVPGNDLGPGEAIGVWLKLTLSAGATPAKNNYTVRASGATT